MLHWARALPLAQFKEQLTRFAREVMPAFGGTYLRALTLAGS